MNTRTYRNTLISSVILFALAISTVYILLLSGIIASGFTLTIVESHVSLLTLIFAGATFMLSIIIECYIIISLLKKKYRGEVDDNRPTERIISRFYTLLLIVMFVITMLFNISMKFDMNYDITEMYDYEGSIPYPLLEQVSPDEWDIIKDSSTVSTEAEISGDSFVFEPLSILTNRQFSIRQYGNGEDKMVFGYNLDNYELTSEKNADKLFNEFCDEVSRNNTQSVNVDGWKIAFYYSYNDGLWINNKKSETDLNGEGLILKDGNRVMKVWYSGSSTLLNSLDVFQK